MPVETKQHEIDRARTAARRVLDTVSRIEPMNRRSPVSIGTALHATGELAAAVLALVRVLEDDDE